MTSQPSISPPLWRWAVEDDEPKTGSESELIRQLASGQLPPYALVWREGWGEWLPAMQVEELAEAFPEAPALGTRTARPSSIPGVPPVPVSEYPRLRHLAKVAPLGWPDGFEGRDQDVITSEVPAAALIEAARAMTQPSPPRDLGLAQAIERASRVPEELTPFTRLDRAALDRAALEGTMLDRGQLDDERTPVSKPALALAAEFGLQGLLDAAAPKKEPPFRQRTHGLWIALAAVTLGLGVTVALRQSGGRVTEPSAARAPGEAVATTRHSLQVPEERSLPEPAGSAPVTAAAASGAPASEGAATARADLPSSGPSPSDGPVPSGGPAALGKGASAASAASLGTVPAAAIEPEPGCRFLHEPVSIDDWAVVDVRPLIFPSPRASAVVVGFAQSHKSATGGTLDVESLQLLRRYWQQDEHQIFSVTPLATSEKVAYHVERMGTPIAFGRALDAKSPLRIGLSDEGIVLGPPDQRAKKLWDMPVGSRMSVPEVAAHAGGFTLATRAGKGAGDVLVGLLDATGNPLSPLTEVGPTDWDFGRPALASGPEQTGLAVTRRANGARPDALFLARAKLGQLPTELQPFEVPPGGEPELLAPVLAALPDGGFALMWSQGAGSRRVVRLSRLSASLEARGPVFEVTAPDPALGGAMAAALHWAGDRLLAFYFLRRDAGHSLWVGSLSCGS